MSKIVINPLTISGSRILEVVEQFETIAKAKDKEQIKAPTKAKVVPIKVRQKWKESIDDANKNNEKNLFGDYFYDGESTLKQGTKVVNGEHVTFYYHIYDGLIEIEKIHIDMDTDKEELVLSSTMFGKKSQKILSKGDLFGKASYVENLNNTRGFLLDPDHGKSVRKFLFDQYIYFERKNKLLEINITSKVGWYNETFVYPQSNITIDGRTFYKKNGHFDRIFISKGSFGDTLKWILLPLLKTEVGIITISATVGSLLLEKLDAHESFIVDLFGKNGKGKTTLLYALASLFGHPRKYCLEWNATKTAIITTASDLNNFPLMLDDTKKCDNKDMLVEVIYSLSGGRERARANQDATLKEAKTFKNIAISTGESSILNYLKGQATGAGAYGRVISLDTDTYNIFDNKEDADRASNIAFNNYGEFGIDFCEWLYEKSKTEKENWYELYNMYKDLNYAKVEHHSSTRKANHIAILQVGYMVLSDYLKDLNIVIPDATEVFNKFLLLSDNTSKEQDVYLKAYENVVEYLIRNSGKICKPSDKEFIPNGLIGWIKNDPRFKNVIFVSDKDLIIKMLNNMGDATDILKEWNKRGYIITDPGKLQKNNTPPYKIDGLTPKQVKTYAININHYAQEQDILELIEIENKENPFDQE